MHGCSPRVLKGLNAGESLLGVQIHQVPDEVLGRVGDIVPVGGIKLVLSLHDLLEELGIVVMVEWRVATQPGQEERALTCLVAPHAHTLCM